MSKAVHLPAGLSEETHPDKRIGNPLSVIIRKEIADHVRSWRFILLLALIMLTCLGALYTSLMTIRESLGTSEGDSQFLFLRLFTLSDGTLPALITFIGFLGPLLGIGLGFDAVNSERNKGTLSRMLSQPIHRDALLHAKFIASLTVISVMFLALLLLVTGCGIWLLGIPPTPEEMMRMLAFYVISLFYVGFWLNLAMVFSVRFRQPATAALTGISIWLFFSVFYQMIINLLARAIQPGEQASIAEMIRHQDWISLLMRLSPGQLYTEATTIMLMPSIRTLSPFVTRDQLIGYIPSPLPVGQSLLLIWPHLTALAAITLICFALSYVPFMRQEIRSR